MAAGVVKASVVVCLFLTLFALWVGRPAPDVVPVDVATGNSDTTTPSHIAQEYTRDVKIVTGVSSPGPTSSTPLPTVTSTTTISPTPPSPLSQLATDNTNNNDTVANQCPWPTVTGSDYKRYTAAVPLYPVYPNDTMQMYCTLVSDDPRGPCQLHGWRGATRNYRYNLGGTTGILKYNVDSEEPLLYPGQWAVGAGKSGTYMRPPLNSSLVLDSPSNRPSIIIYMLDSLSQAQFLREMPKLQAVMKNSELFHNFFFERYHSMGGGSAKNKVPLHSGMPYHAFTKLLKPDVDILGEPGGLMDTYDQWLYQEARRQKYVSWHGEYTPLWKDLSHFDRSKVRPFDVEHYWKSLLVDHPFPSNIKFGQFTNITEPAHGFISGTFEASMALDWAIELNYQYRSLGTPTVGQFLTWWSHDPQMKAERRIDGALAQYLSSKLKRDPHKFKNTVMLFIGDHGNHGPYLSYPEGDIEFKSPLLSMLVSKDVNLTPKQLLALKANQHTLATHYDTYQTMRHIIMGEDYTHYGMKEGRSLLKQLPKDRTCSDAGIDVHACICVEMRGEILDPLSQECLSMANRSISMINARLARQQNGTNICQALDLSALTECKRFVMLDQGTGLRRKDVEGQALFPINNAFRYDLMMEMNTTRKDAMILHIQAAKRGKYGDDHVVVTRAKQLSRFAAYVEPCQERIRKYQIDLHMCDCNNDNN